MLSKSKIAEMQTLVELISGTKPSGTSIQAIYDAKLLALRSPQEPSPEQGQKARSWHEGMPRAAEGF